MDEVTLKRLASIGLLKVVTDAAKNVVVDEYQEATTPTVESLIADTIKRLECRPHTGTDHATLIDALSETIQDAINILMVAKGFFDVKES